MPGVGHFSMSEIPGVFGKILPVFVSMRVVWKVSLSPPLDRKPYNRDCTETLMEARIVNNPPPAAPHIG